MTERELKRDPHFILRSNTLSAALTIAVLVGTVVAVYTIFPRRDNELMTRAAALHRGDEALELERPADADLRAWSIGALGAPVPWPTAGVHLEIVGARSVQIQRKPAAMVRLRAGGDRVTLVAQHARDPAPRRHQRADGGDLLVSWRSGKWTLVAVGPVGTAPRWRALVGAP